MNFIRDIKKRIFTSGVIGMLICVLMSGVFDQKMPLAWWGILYPEYCFMEVNTNKDEIEQERNTPEKIKISFWLAKVFDW